MDKDSTRAAAEAVNTVFSHVVTTAERVGIPVATFGVGAWAIFLSGYVSIPVLPWVGVVLILASLATYVWLTARSTAAEPSPPPPLPRELQDTLNWMKNELEKQNAWARRVISQLPEDGANGTVKGGPEVPGRGPEPRVDRNTPVDGQPREGL